MRTKKEAHKEGNVGLKGTKSLTNRNPFSGHLEHKSSIYSENIVTKLIERFFIAIVSLIVT